MVYIGDDKANQKIVKAILDYILYFDRVLHKYIIKSGVFNVIHDIFNNCTDVNTVNRAIQIVTFVDSKKLVYSNN